MDTYTNKPSFPIHLSFIVRSFALGLLFVLFGIYANGQASIDVNFTAYPGDDSTFAIQDTVFVDYIEVGDAAHDTLNGYGGGITETNNKLWNYNPAQAGIGYDSLIVVKGGSYDTLVIAVLPRIEFDTIFSVCNNDPDFALTHAIDTPGGGSIYYYDNNNAVVNGRFYPDSVAPGTYNVFVNDTIYDDGIPFIGRDTTTVTVNTIPTKYDLLPKDTSFCQGDPGVEIWLSGRTAGIDYVLYKDGVAVDTQSRASGGDTLQFSGLYKVGNYTAKAFDGTCSSTMNGTTEVTEIYPDFPNLIYYGSDTSYCEGGVGVELGIDNSQPGVSYYLISNGTDTAAIYHSNDSSAHSFGYQRDSVGYYTLDMTNGACVIENEDSLKVYIDPKPTEYFLDGPDGYCTGSSATLELSNSEDSVSYTLYRDSDGNSFGTKAGSAGSPLYWSVSDTGTFYVMAQNDTTLCEARMNGQVTLEE